MSSEDKDEEILVSQIHTTCRNCVFARYNKESPMSQTGCTLNKLDDYKEAGIEILEVYDEDNVEFNLINGRFCLFYRNEELMKNTPRDSWEDIVNLQTKIPYQIILFFEEDNTFADLKRSIMKIKDQDVQPNMVTIMNKQYLAFAEDQENNIKPSIILDVLKNSEFHKFSLKNVYDKSLDDRSLVDLVFDSTKSSPYPFYTTFQVGYDIPQDFSKCLNNAVLIKMMQLGFVKPIDSINGMIVNKITHKKHGGNSFGIGLEDKILKFEENGEKFIFEIGDICPSMK